MFDRLFDRPSFYGSDFLKSGFVSPVCLKNGSGADRAVFGSRVTKRGLDVVIARDDHDPDEFDVFADEVKRVWDADDAKGDVGEADISA